MALHKLEGQDWIFKFDPAGGTSYKNIVCIKSLKLNSQDAEIDASSFCGAEFRPGLTTETIDIDAYSQYDPGAANLSSADVYEAKQAKTEIGWSITRVTPVTGDPVKTGKGYILSMSEDYSLNQDAGFSFQIKVSGDITQTITV